MSAGYLAAGGRDGDLAPARDVARGERDLELGQRRALRLGEAADVVVGVADVLAQPPGHAGGGAGLGDQDRPPSRPSSRRARSRAAASPPRATSSRSAATAARRSERSAGGRGAARLRWAIIGRPPRRGARRPRALPRAGPPRPRAPPPPARPEGDRAARSTPQGPPRPRPRSGGAQDRAHERVEAVHRPQLGRHGVGQQRELRAPDQDRGCPAPAERAGGRGERRAGGLGLPSLHGPDGVEHRRLVVGPEAAAGQRGLPLCGCPVGCKRCSDRSGM